MAQIELILYPPLSYRFSESRQGSCSLTLELLPGDTPESLIFRLHQAEAGKLGTLYDPEKKKFKAAVQILLNDQPLSRDAFITTVLEDRDCLILAVLYHGG